jgi:tryptophan synthase beta chain
MELLGATVETVDIGAATLKEAINAALRDWAASYPTTHYLLGTVAGPHPFPTIVREFQSVIGIEARAQFVDAVGALPDVVLACVGGGSNAIGIWSAFLDDGQVQLIGVEAAGHGLHTEHHGATLERGRPGVLHGAYTYVLQDDEGQIAEAHSVSAGLDYPGVGPEHAHLLESGRASYVGVVDEAALTAAEALAQAEGIIPALESAHAVAHALELAQASTAPQTMLINLSGRGDKDLETMMHRR